MEAVSLTEFLLARIEEDEADARERGVAAEALALAECQAKRRIVENLDGVRLEQPAIRMYREGLAEVTLRMLALPYVGHPDYREEWKP